VVDVLGHRHRALPPQVAQQLGEDVPGLLVRQTELAKARTGTGSRQLAQHDTQQPDSLQRLSVVEGDQLASHPEARGPGAPQPGDVIVEEMFALPHLRGAVDEILHRRWVLAGFLQLRQRDHDHSALQDAFVRVLQIGGEVGRHLPAVGEEQQLAAVPGEPARRPVVIGWQLLVERRAEHGRGGLAAALQQPDETRAAAAARRARVQVGAARVQQPHRT
jgi:hypothetical protein